MVSNSSLKNITQFYGRLFSPLWSFLVHGPAQLLVGVSSKKSENTIVFCGRVLSFGSNMDYFGYSMTKKSRAYTGLKKKKIIIIIIACYIY